MKKLLTLSIWCVLMVNVTTFSLAMQQEQSSIPDMIEEFSKKEDWEEKNPQERCIMLIEDLLNKNNISDVVKILLGKIKEIPIAQEIGDEQSNALRDIINNNSNLTTELRNALLASSDQTEHKQHIDGLRKLVTQKLQPESDVKPNSSQDAKLLTFHISQEQKQAIFERINQKLTVEANTYTNVKTQLNTEPKEPQQYSHISSLFNGHILGTDNEMLKMWLCEAWHKKHGAEKIKNTKLIFRSVFENGFAKSNFHLYFDDIAPLVLLVRLKNGHIIGAMLEKPFKKKTTQRDPKAIIFSLTNTKVWNVQPEKHSHVYDDFYIIIGNSEIRLRSQEPKVFSNFGISNGHYIANGSQINDLLGAAQNREPPIESYEIYELQIATE